jgi:hypothetical protein
MSGSGAINGRSQASSAGHSGVGSAPQAAVDGASTRPSAQGAANRRRERQSVAFNHRSVCCDHRGIVVSPTASLCLLNFFAHATLTRARKVDAELRGPIQNVASRSGSECDTTLAINATRRLAIDTETRIGTRPSRRAPPGIIGRIKRPVPRFILQRRVPWFNDKRSRCMRGIREPGAANFPRCTRTQWGKPQRKYNAPQKLFSPGVTGHTQVFQIAPVLEGAVAQFTESVEKNGAGERIFKQSLPLKSSITSS